LPAPKGPLLEVPATIGFLQRNEAWCRRAIANQGLARRLHLKGILERAHIVNLRWLSPELSSARDMIALATRLLRKGCAHLNMSFHSTTLVPGKTPFVRTSDDLKRFLRSTDELLRFVADQGVEFCGLAHSLQGA
jgi:hypothetical protein